MKKGSRLSSDKVEAGNYFNALVRVVYACALNKVNIVVLRRKGTKDEAFEKRFQLAYENIKAAGSVLLPKREGHDKSKLHSPSDLKSYKPIQKRSIKFQETLIQEIASKAVDEVEFRECLFKQYPKQSSELNRLIDNTVGYREYSRVLVRNEEAPELKSFEEARLESFKQLEEDSFEKVVYKIFEIAVEEAKKLDTEKLLEIDFMKSKLPAHKTKSVDDKILPSRNPYLTQLCVNGLSASLGVGGALLWVYNEAWVPQVGEAYNSFAKLFAAYPMEAGLITGLAVVALFATACVLSTYLHKPDNAVVRVEPVVADKMITAPEPVKQVGVSV